MLHFCTYSDKNYLLKGLCLNKSLEETIECDYTLHYLCLDRETYDTFRELDHRFIHPVQLSELEKTDKNIALARKLKKGMFGDDYSAFAWALAPIWINFCLKNYVPANKPLTYTDSDIQFYKMFSADNIPNAGLHRHRYSGKYEYKTNPVGEFNVGVMVFINNPTGNYLCETWKNWVLNPSHPEYGLFGTCGDQKWLDKLYLNHEEHLTIFDDPDFAELAHLAPWNTHNASEIDFDSKTLLFEGQRQKIFFYHFSHFRADFKNDKWHSSLNGEWAPEANREVKKFYDHYFETQKQIKTTFQLLNL